MEKKIVRGKSIGYTRSHLLKITALLFAMMAATSMLVSIVEAQTLTLGGVATWYWVGDTRIESVCSTDVDGDGQAEIVTGGWYNDGTRDRAQLAVWRRAPTTVTIEAIADSYMNSSSPDSNYGSETSVKIGITTGTTKNHTYTYIMFDLSSIPSNAVINSANLSLYMTHISGLVPTPPGGRIKIHYCNDTSWTELGVTWNNKPPFDSEATSYRTFVGTEIPVLQYYDWNVTSDVSRALSNGKLTEVVKWPNYTHPDVYARAHFQSKEAANKPKLIVEYFTYSLTLEAVVDWYWTGNTHILSVCAGDVDGDGQTEIVTGGRHYDGGRYHAQLAVWNASNLALENVVTWYWVSSTYIESVAVGDVDGDDSIEIVTGGRWHDITRERAQLCVWNGSTLALEDATSWYWLSNTKIESVAVGDVDGDSHVEIVTGGYYFDITRYNAQLAVWNGSDLALESVTSWYWGLHSFVFSVAVGDVDGDSLNEIVTGGYHNIAGASGGYRGQLVVWNASNMAVKGARSWYWGSVTPGHDTVVYSVTLGDVDGDSETEIITGGTTNDGSYRLAQLILWNGTNLAVEKATSWYWTNNTDITSVAVGDTDGDAAIEIATGGYYYDNTRNVAQLTVWTT